MDLAAGMSGRLRRGTADALGIRPAPVLRQLVEDAITQYIDQDALRVTRLAEQSERHLLTWMRQMTDDADT